MKKTLYAILAATAFLFSGKCMSGQDYVAPPVTVSRNTVKQDGKLYYSHVVQEKQTLYSISKAYGVSLGDIYEANPSLKENGLKKNEIILIPAVLDKKEGRTVKDDEVRQDEDRKSDREDRKSKEGKKAGKQKKDDYFTHTVKWYENLDDISQKYGISVEAIMKINNLTGRKLKNRQKLRIPADPQSYMEADELSEGSKNEETEEKATAVPAEKDGHTEEQSFTSRSSINAVLMLPFDAAGEHPDINCMDFYSGALLAVRELGNKGLNIDLSVYDTGNGALPITAERLEKSDVVIGPIASRELSELLKKTPAETYIISPLDHRADTIAATHRNFIQVPAPAEAQYRDIAQWVNKDRQPADSVIIIYEKGLKINKELNILKSTLSKGYSTFSYSILEGRNILAALSRKMTSYGQNRVLVASESEAFVNDVIRNLNLLIHNKYSITLYGASKIRSFETIDAENLHNTNLHASLSYYIDYDSPQVKDFLLKYRALYNTEPTRFAFQGYDTMHYFCSISSKYGDKWPDKLNVSGAEMLQSDYRFSRKGEHGNGGFANTAVRRVVYGPDYSMTLLTRVY